MWYELSVKLLKNMFYRNYMRTQDRTSLKSFSIHKYLFNQINLPFIFRDRTYISDNGECRVSNGTKLPLQSCANASECIIGLDCSGGICACPPWVFSLFAGILLIICRDFFFFIFSCRLCLTWLALLVHFAKSAWFTRSKELLGIPTCRL